MIETLTDPLVNLLTNTVTGGLNLVFVTLEFGGYLIKSAPELINHGLTGNLRGSGVSQSITREGKMLWKTYNTFFFNLIDNFQERRQYRLPGKPYQPLPEIKKINFR